MGNVVLFMHVSLDAFVAGPNGEMDWIKISEELFEYAARRTEEADTALYGRVTYDMMEAYWPTAGEKPDASKHDVEHSAWYNKVTKVVISKTMKGTGRKNTRIISENVPSEIRKLKSETPRNILMFGSPTAAHSLMKDNLIDDYWLFINPVLLGQGIPLFKDIRETIKLKPCTGKTLSSGVVCLHYSVNNK